MARPAFVRLVSALDATATFKPRKMEYAAQGFDPALISGALFFADAAASAFVPLDAALHARLVVGAVPV